MTITRHAALTHVQQRDVTAEENLRRITDILDFMYRWVIDDRLTAPPSGIPANGYAALVIATGTDEFVGKENQIALYLGGWVFLLPKENWEVWVDDENERYRYNGSAWVMIPTPAAQQSAVTSLTDSTGGSAGNTLQPSFFDQTIEDNFASLAAKVNTILAALRTHKLIQT